MSAKVALLEVASVIAIIGSVAAIAVPKTALVQDTRTSETVAADIETVRAAVYAFHADSTFFPREASQGDMPLGLETYLPARFSFRRAWGTIEYRNWPASVPFRVAEVRADTALPDTLVRDSAAIAPRTGIPVDSALAELAPMTRNPSVRVPTIATVPQAAAVASAADSTITSRVIGVSVMTHDPRVGLNAAQRARRMARVIVGDKVTFILSGA